eukprot:597453-Pyramimonas_sp.AAC.1
MSIPSNARPGSNVHSRCRSWRRLVQPPGQPTPYCVSPTASRASSMNIFTQARIAVRHIAQPLASGRMSS